jgi:hypothetical protein
LQQVLGEFGGKQHIQAQACLSLVDIVVDDSCLINNELKRPATVAGGVPGCRLARLKLWTWMSHYIVV